MTYFRRIFVGFCFCLLLLTIGACSPVRWLIVNSNGIATYNRRTGQLEVLWESNYSKGDYPKDGRSQTPEKPDSVILRVLK